MLVFNEVMTPVEVKLAREAADPTLVETGLMSEFLIVFYDASTGVLMEIAAYPLDKLLEHRALLETAGLAIAGIELDGSSMQQVFRYAQYQAKNGDA